MAIYKTQILMLALLGFWTSLSAHSTEIEKPIELKETKDIKDAKAFGHSLEVLNNKIRACVQQGIAKQQECECRYPEEYAATKAAFDKTLEAHPGWRNQAIVIREHETHNRVFHISFRALDRAFGAQSLDQRCRVQRLR